jgi:hypothetical protein
MDGKQTAVSRRGFLGTAGTASLAGLLGAASPVRADLDSDRKIRIGVVGGGFGASFQWHLDQRS